jgi:hypothetical protein
MKETVPTKETPRVRKTGIAPWLITAAMLLFIFSIAGSANEPHPLATGASTRSAMPPGVFPEPIASASAHIRDAYFFAADPRNDRLFKALGCYCGHDVGRRHSSLYSGFVEQIMPGGHVVYSNHALGCYTCLSEAWDAADWSAQGKGVPEIKELIETKYGGRPAR